MDKPDKLYKYCDQGGLNILETNEIKVSHFFDFNDPFEINPVFDKNEVKKHFEIILNNALKKTHKAIPDSEIEALEKAFREDLHKMYRKVANDNTYLLCFSTTPDNLLMWAHYAGQHKGIVIEFDGKHDFFQEHLDQQNNSKNFRKVNYPKDKNRPPCSIKSLQNRAPHSFDNHIQNNFFTKSADWEYEQEWRMVFPPDNENIREETPQNNKKHFLLKFPPDCISGVIIGCRAWEKENDQESFAEKLINKIEERRQYYSSDFQIKKAVLDESEYKLNIKNVLKIS